MPLRHIFQLNLAHNYFLSPDSCLMSLVSCLLPHISCLSHLLSLASHASHLKSHVSCLMSSVSCLTSVVLSQSGNVLLTKRTSALLFACRCTKSINWWQRRTSALLFAYRWIESCRQPIVAEPQLHVLPIRQPIVAKLRQAIIVGTPACILSFRFGIYRVSEPT